MEYKNKIHQLDEKNDELLNLSTMLNKAIQTCRRKELNLVIKFLEKFSNDTNQDQNSLAESPDYISYSSDKAEHEKFKSIVTDLRTLYDTDKPAAHLIFFMRKHIDQLMSHIQNLALTAQESTQTLDHSSPHEIFEVYLKKK